MACRWLCASAREAVVHKEMAQGDLRTRRHWFGVCLVIAFGVSAHVTKQAFPPAQLALQSAGISPVLYAFVAASPLIGSMLLPTLWGLAHEQSEQQVLVALPSGELIGQIIVAMGLALLTWGPSSSHDSNHLMSSQKTESEVLLAIGLAAFSCFHGGVAVVQHTTLARLMPRGLTSGFVAMVACTHLSTAFCNSVVPTVLRLGGLFAVQMVLLVPSLILSVPAGLILARRAGDTPSKEDFLPIVHEHANEILRVPLLEPCACDCSKIAAGPMAPEARDVESRATVWKDSCICGDKGPAGQRECLPRSYVVFMLALWRALLIGLGHAFQSVLNGLLVSFGLTEEIAGMRLAAGQAGALALLPLVGLLADLCGRRWLLVIISWLALGAGVALSHGPLLPTFALNAALLAWSLAQVSAPVLALSLIPANSPRRDSGPLGGNVALLGRSFGILESLASFAQIAFLMMIGCLQETGGFTSVLKLLCTGLTAAAGLSVALLAVARDDVGPTMRARG
mmetsp:Transcript_19669/g.52964  ORF Transcript_19669/g.52964 Transcript_19669/m.52964 type:complete len:510 (-) Transcript_19669:305-1834(-)